MNRKTQRLTLVEVIIVLALIIVFTTIVCFVRKTLHISRERARRISCKSNLKQIGLAARMYSNVYFEEFPNFNGRTGLQMLATNGFLENTQVYICPSTEDDVAITTDISANASYAWAGGLNEASSVDSAISADRAFNHTNWGNVLFVDGHVKGYAGGNWTRDSGGSVLTDFEE